MKKVLLIVSLLLGIAGPGCNLNLADVPSSQALDTTRAWFDSPLPGSVFYPPDPVCPIVAHGASPAGIATFELSINGEAVSLASPDTQSSLATLTRNCDLSRPGVYNLLLRVQDNAGEWSGYAETSLIISEAITVTPEAAVPTPTSTPTPSPPGNVSIESISSDLVYVGDTSCGASQVTIVAHASAPNDIALVVLFYRFEPGSPSGFQDADMHSVGGDLYEVTLNPTSLLGGFMTADQATLQYQVVVQQEGGDTSIRTPVLADIALLPCGDVILGCSSYGSQRECESHGCAWVAAPAIVPVYACENP